MKTITEMQALLELNYDLQSCFEEKLSDEHKTFLQIIRAAESLLSGQIYV